MGNFEKLRKGQSGRGSFFLLIKHDLAQGFSDNRLKFVIAVLCFVTLCALFFSGYDAVLRMSALGMGAPLDSKGFTLGDVVLHVSSGMGEYQPDIENPFVIPIQWLIVQIVLAVMVGYYPVGDLTGYASQTLIRVRSTWAWWFSKCVWIVLTVGAFYLVELVVLAGFTAIFGNFASLQPSDGLSVVMDGFGLASVDGSLVVAALLTAPVLSLALSLVQVTLSLFVGPFMSFVALMTYYVASVYFATNFLIGDYSMVARSGIVAPAGVHPMVALVVCLIVAVVAVLVGGWALGKRDLLRKERV